MALELGHLSDASLDGYRLYHFREGEKIQEFLRLVQNPDDILFRKEKIDIFETIMHDFFPDLALTKSSVSGGVKGYIGVNRKNYVLIRAYAPLNLEGNTDLELRIYPFNETHAHIGLVALHYEMHPIDDIARMLSDNNYAYAMRETKEDGYAVCSLAGVDDIPLILKKYKQARTLFFDTDKLISDGIFRRGDLEVLFRDKRHHPNYAIRKASHTQYHELLHRLLVVQKENGKNS